MGLDGFKWFVGVVEDYNDPDKLGRVKVRAYGFHTKDKTDIPTDSLPWASVMAPTNDTSMQGIGKFSKLVNGTWVVGFYMDAAEMQNPIVMGTLKGKPSYKDSRFGFSDPNDVYPEQKNSSSGHGTDKDDNDFTTETQFIESDVNRLAKNDANNIHPEIVARDEAQTKEVPIANDTETTWNEPLTTDESTRGKEASGRNPETKEDRTAPYKRRNTEYPYNRTYETESGHVVEFDDTPFAERIYEKHRTGTFYEVDADGNKVTRIVGNNYQIIAGAEYVNVKGDVNLTIDSNCNTYIKGNWNIQVDGTKTEVVTGAVSETYKATKTENVTGLVSETYQANQTTNITGTLDLDASSEVDIDAGVINLN